MAKIESLKNDLKTMHDLEDLTNVLEQVAARDIAQMRKQILQSRPFFQHVWRIHKILSALTPPPPEVIHKHLIVVMAIDWGMPGNLLNRVLDKAEELYDEHGADMLIAGKMGHSRFANRNDRTIHYFSAPKKSAMNEMEPIYKVISNYARVSYVFPKFESLSKQHVDVASVSVDEELVVKKSEENQSDITNNIDVRRFTIEPSAQEISNYMNQVVVGMNVYHYFSEAMLAYNAAQMVAMRNAYDNARDEAKVISYRYNKARREQIDIKLRELYGSRPSTVGGKL